MEEEISITNLFRRMSSDDYYISTINPSKNNNHSIIDLPPGYLLPSSFPKFFSIVALDSKIYVLGGRMYNKSDSYYYRKTSSLQRDVYCMDTRSRYYRGWKRCSPMILARSGALPIAVNEKIYVFGGNVDSRKEEKPVPWAEVFDSVAETWSPLPAPPSGFTEDCMYGFNGGAYCCGKIFIGTFDNKILLYDISSLSWESWSAPVKFSSFAVIDNIIYFCGTYGLYAYDYTKTVKFVGSIDGLKMFYEKILRYVDRENEPEGYVFHVGNRKLCLIGRRSEHLVIVIKFHVVRYYDAEEQIFLCANVESSAVYNAEGELENCIL